MGKSTYINKHLRDAVRICHDDLYQMMTGRWQKEKWTVYHAVENAAILAALQQDADVVVDRTNLDKRTRQRFIELGQQVGADIIAIFMNVSLETAKRRNRNADRKKSGRTVPDTAYDKLMANFEPPSIEEGFVSIDIVS